MNINSKIFKAYDIRGVYPNELNPKIAFLIGLSFAKKTRAKQVVIGRDMRQGGLMLKKALIKGLAQGGVKEIVDIGMVAIDGVYFAVGQLKYESGIMITASHNPRQYNGLKMIGKKLKVIRGIDLLPLVKKNQTTKSRLIRPQIKKINIYPSYIKHILSFAELEKIKPLKVVVDAGNGMAGKVMPKLEKYLPIKMIKMNFELNGSFPAHPSNPLEPASQKGIIKKVKQSKADFGIILDGDTDRLFFVTEKGQFVPADITLPLLAKIFLNKKPGSAVVYNLLCSKIVPESIAAWGGQPIKSAVGFVNVRQAMKRYEALVGGEVSAHYSFKDNAYFDSGFIAFLIFLELLSKEGKKISQLIKPFNKYYKLPETNYKVDNIEKKLQRVKAIYAKYNKHYLDGVTVDEWEKDGWWFNVRPSNTEPLLRINIEAKTKKRARKLKKELVNIINN